MRGVRSWKVVPFLGLVLVVLFPQTAMALPSTSPSPTWQANGKVDSIVYANGVVYLGGDFTSVRPPGSGGTAVTRNYAAALNASTGALLPWDPNANGPVRSIAVAPGAGKVYLGGNFTTIKGAAHNRLAAVAAAVNPSTGQNQSGVPVSGWTATVAAEVKALAVSSDGSKVFVGGLFHNVNGQTRNLAAAVSGSNGSLLAWNPNAQQVTGQPCPPRCYPAVYALRMSADGGSVYIGGSFATVGGVARNSAARVNATTAAVMPWNPNVYFGVTTKGSQNVVYEMAALGSRVYLCGDFFRVGGDTASNVATNIAAVDATTGARDRGFVTSTDGAVNACVASSAALYLGGHFQKVGGTEQGINGQSRNHIAAVNPTTGATLSWNPGANSIPGLYALAIGASRLGAGGDFTVIGGVAQESFAQFAGTP
jgi:hypothetical protein